MNEPRRWWQRLPLLRALLILLCGIIAARCLPNLGMQAPLLILFLGGAYQLGMTVYSRFRPISYRDEYLKHIGFIAILLGCAWLYAHLRNPRAQKTHLSKYTISGSVTLEAQIIECKKRPGKSTRFTLALHSVQQDRVTGQLWLYSEQADLGKGMCIRAKGNILNFAKKDTLQEWQQNAYNRGIDGIVYARKQAFAIEITEKVDAQKRFLFRSQEYISDVFRKNLPDSLACFATALCIGEKEGLSKFLQSDYTACGLSHILAVSGMHLGLVVIALQKMLYFLRKKVRWQALILIAFIWGFAFLAGASAAVLRAAVMYSITLAGPLFYRKAKAENGIVASLFILLLLDPANAFDVGFQLSYAAIISIFWIYPRLYHLLFFKNKILQASWNLVALSITAQLLTAPLCLFYFKQFPNYFLLANLWAIPISTIVLYALLLLLVIQPITWLAGVWKLVCAFSIHYLNLIIHKIACVPGAVSHLPNFNGLNAIGLFLTVYFLMRIAEKQNAARIIQTALISILFFL